MIITMGVTTCIMEWIHPDCNVRNPDLGLEVPMEDRGDGIMILVATMEAAAAADQEVAIGKQLTAPMMLGKRPPMHFYRI